MAQDGAINLAFGLNLDQPGPAADLGGDPAGVRFWEGLLARLDGHADLLTLSDPFGGEASGFDAIILANRLGPLAREIGLVPAAAVDWQEPFHISTAVATLDYVTRGRAGLLLQSAPAAAAAAVGRLPGFPEPEGDPAQDRRDAAIVIRALWDSWRDDAVIRDAASHRFLDAGRLARVGFRGKTFSVLGPSITPRPPQGRPPVAASAAQAQDVALAAETGDFVFLASAALLPEARKAGIAAPWLDLALGAAPAGVQAEIWSGSPADLVARVGEWRAQGLAGLRFLLRDLCGDPAVLTGDFIPALRAAGLWRPAPELNLRDRLGLGPALHPHLLAS